MRDRNSYIVLNFNEKLKEKIQNKIVGYRTYCQLLKHLNHVPVR